MSTDTIARDYIRCYGAQTATDCRTCRATDPGEPFEPMRAQGEPHVHCAVCDGALLADTPACVWCGTFAPWTCDPIVTAAGSGELAATSGYVIASPALDGPGEVFATYAMAERAARACVLGPYDDDTARAAESAVRAGRETRFTADPRPTRRGTFADWLGGRVAEYVPHRAPERDGLVPAGCPRGLGEGDRTRRIYTEPSGAVGFADPDEYGRVHAGDVRRGYGAQTIGTAAACERMGAAARIAASIGTAVSGVTDPAGCRAARQARADVARQAAIVGA